MRLPVSNGRSTYLISISNGQAYLILIVGFDSAHLYHPRQVGLGSEISTSKSSCNLKDHLKKILHCTTKLNVGR